MNNIEKGAVIMELNKRRTIAIIMMFAMIFQVFSAMAYADDKIVAKPSQALISSKTNEEIIEEPKVCKAKVINPEGADVFDSINEDAEPVDHYEKDTELLVLAKDEKWYSICFENETSDERYILQSDIMIIDENELTDEEMLAMGYVKVVVCMNIGADIYDGIGKDAKVVDHYDVETDLWISLIDGCERALEFNIDENADKRYINLVDLIAILKPETMESLPTRSVTVKSTIEDEEFVYYGSWEEMTATIDGFQDDDVYTIQWKFSADQGATFNIIEGANELKYGYIVTEENLKYIWRISITLEPKVIEYNDETPEQNEPVEKTESIEPKETTEQTGTAELTE